MLLQSAKCCDFSQEGNLYVRKYCGTEGIHNKHPSETYVKEADHFGIVSGGKEDKFSATKLTAVKSDLVDAPYIKEFPLVLECKLTHTVEIGLHTQFIGEILDVKVEDSVLGEGGTIDIEKMRPFFYAPEIRAYYGIGKCLGKAFSVGKQI